MNNETYTDNYLKTLEALTETARHGAVDASFTEQPKLKTLLFTETGRIELLHTAERMVLKDWNTSDPAKVAEYFDALVRLVRAS